MTRSAVVLGAGRSGTSLVAGLLADAGLDPGADLLPSSPANPTGYFESPHVNALNDDLLEPHLPRSLIPVPRRLSWLAALPPDLAPRATERQRATMAALLPPAPYVLKDPRLSFTLDAWRPVLTGDPVLVCVFRDPARVAESVRRDALRSPEYYEGLPEEAAWASWAAAYLAVLKRHAGEGRWVFVDADALLAGAGVDALADAIGAPIPLDRVDPSLWRSAPALPHPPGVAEVYGELRRRASP